jgi:hypothetical protein
MLLLIVNFEKITEETPLQGGRGATGRKPQKGEY